jgi:hypothetical protein
MGLVPNIMCIEMVERESSLSSSKNLPQRRSNFAILAGHEGKKLFFPLQTL